MHHDPMIPTPFRVKRTRKELDDTFTLELLPARGRANFHFAAGQFNMLYLHGVGEVPISISGDPGDPSVLIHTTRAVGTVTDAMWKLKAGDTVGIRGPFGTAWPVVEAEGSDVVIVTGGIGLAPLRPAIYHILNNRKRYGNVVILYGARTPEDILYRKEVEKWRGRLDMSLEVTVDRATGDWVGNVGVVPRLVTRGGFDPTQTVAMVCGPEIMMRYTVQAFNDQGVSNDRIYVSMERNMKCAVGFCGHCQFGTSFVCKDGPVFRFDKIEQDFYVREL